MNPKIRQAIERRIATQVVDDLLAQSYSITVDNGDEEDSIKLSKNRTKILRAMFQTDEDRVYVHDPGSEKPSGWVYLVYGNEGTDVLSDYTVNLEEALKPSRALADRIEAGDLSGFPKE